MTQILLVEDDLEICEILQFYLLKQSNYNVTVAHSSKEARMLTGLRNYDLILMDIKMPVMNGLDATKIIRGENKEIPIIMQTAYAFTADRENAMAAGASEVLVKPITLSALRTCLSRFLPQLQW